MGDILHARPLCRVGGFSVNISENHLFIGYHLCRRPLQDSRIRLRGFEACWLGMACPSLRAHRMCVIAIPFLLDIAWGGKEIVLVLD